MSSGIKKFVDNTSLTAFDINEYLMNQTVMVFASSAARTSAFTAAGVTITEGMVTYLLDVNAFQVYNGTVWVNPNQNTQNSTGLECVTPTTVTNGTFVANTVTFTNQPSVTINGIFTSSFTNYRLVYKLASTGSATAYMRVQLTASGTPVTSNYLHKTLWTDVNLATSAIGNFDQATTGFCFGPTGTPTDAPLCGTADVFSPFDPTVSTQMTNNASGLYASVAFYTVWGGGFQRNANAYDGIKLFNNTGNISGSVSIYGYRS